MNSKLLIQNQGAASGVACGNYSASYWDGGDRFQIITDIACQGVSIRPARFVRTGGSMFQPTGYWVPSTCPTGYTFRETLNANYEQGGDGNGNMYTKTVTQASCFKD